ncbi:hypothetical protein [Planctomyces sp. SH-PL62]|uniref:hypothetical protein n=1 Tax=Planctomyces sp. SH-PL62 TaxID=1636152 RepID=UPI00078B6127|nr:hypothetical protein [Planctomyces sp. SH-PL62]AMV40752.1 hypothetical protein VT85_25190 [Planctomyces sp. SH-PL62]
MAVSLAIDYSLDASGFFTADRRAALESTLGAIAARLNDTLAAVPTANYTLETASGGRTVRTSVAADTLKVYAYGDALTDSIAQGGAFYSLPQNNAMRGQGANDYAPDVTYLKFDDDGSTSWYFGASTAGLTGSQVDFPTVARHEFLHALGFLSSQPTFARFLQNGAFIGPDARAANGGAAVPVSGSHVAAQVPSIMNAVTMQGERTELTDLEWGFLRDFGWSVVATPPAGASFVRDFDLFTGGQGEGLARVKVVPSRGVHLMRLDVLAGDTLRLRTLDGSIAAERGADSFLKIFDESGREILRDDDSPGAATGKEDLTYTFPVGGRYWVGASAFDQRDYTFTTPWTGSASSPAFYLEATLTGRAGDEPHQIAGASQAVPFAGGTYARETTLAGAAADYYRIDAVAGASYAITTALPAAGGLPGASVAAVYDAQGRRVAAMSGSAAYGALNFTAQATAAYYVRIARSVGPAAVAPNEAIADPGFRVAFGDGASNVEGARSQGHDYSLTIIETAAVPPPNLHPLFLDYGASGLWRWSEAGGFRQINAADPQDLVVAADGSLYVDYGGFGVWRWTEAGGLRQVNAADPEALATGPDGELYVDYGRFGLWRWTAADGFKLLSGADPEGFAAGASGELYVDYERFGLWRWAAADGFRQINAADPEGFVVGDAGTLYVDFGPSGLWLWTPAGGFHRLHASNPEGFAPAPWGTLAVDFGADGLWSWSRSQDAFTRLNPANPEGLVGAADGWLYVDFGPHGVWRWSAAGGLRKLNGADPQRIAARPTFGRT